MFVVACFILFYPLLAKPTKASMWYLEKSCWFAHNQSFPFGFLMTLIFLFNSAFHFTPICQAPVHAFHSSDYNLLGQNHHANPQLGPKVQGYPHLYVCCWWCVCWWRLSPASGLVWCSKIHRVLSLRMRDGK